jgi:hypothetical protein
VRLRSQPTPEPVVADAAELERRWLWLYRWCSLTLQGSGVDIRESGITAQRVAHLEAELDRLGVRAKAEAFLDHLEASAQRTQAHIDDLRRGGFGPCSP